MIWGGLVVANAALLSLPASAEALSAFDNGLQNKAGLAFAPDAETAYLAAWDGKWGSEPTSPRTIYVSARRGNSWTEPVVVDFSGTFNDDDPFVSPDGRWLYFVSDRPVEAGGDKTNGDIWRYSLDGDEVLERLDINSDAAEYSPVVTHSGALFFASARDGGFGQGDIYRAAATGDGFAEPELLGSSINSPTGEWNVWVSPDETEMLFEASSRTTNVSVPGDLYYSRRNQDGWTEAVPLSSLNSAGSDLLPRLHPDGETLYFTVAEFNGHARISSADWASIRNELR